MVNELYSYFTCHRVKHNKQLLLLARGEKTDKFSNFHYFSSCLYCLLERSTNTIN